MALDSNPVGTAIAAKVKLLAPIPGTPVTDAQLETLWKAIVKEIFDHIKANGVVTVTGVMSGGSTSGPGTMT